MSTEITNFFTEAINLSLIDKVFYLSILLVILFMFKSSLRTLLASVSSIKFAGNSFDFENKKDNSKYYSHLGDMFYELLSSGSLNERSVWNNLTDRSISNLALFLKDYLAKIPADEQDIRMLENGCFILVRKHRGELAKKIIEELADRYPGDSSIMHKYGLILLLTNTRENVRKSQEIYVKMCERDPKAFAAKFNLVLTYCFLENFDTALQLLRELKENNYTINFKDPYLNKISVVRKSDIDSLR